MRTLMTVLAVGMVLYAAPGYAQQVEIEAPAPAPRQRVVVPPGDHYEMTRPSDADFYPDPPRVRHDPAFIAPLSKKFETATGGTGRMGVSGWTAPNTPVGSESTGRREVTGWFALGFSVEWGGPPPPAKRSVR